MFLSSNAGRSESTGASFRRPQSALAINNLDRKRRQIGRANLEIAVELFDGPERLSPNVMDIVATIYTRRIHCGDELPAVAGVDNPDGVRQSHPRLANTGPRVEIKTERLLPFSHCAFEAKPQKSGAVYTCAVFVIQIIVSIERHENVKSGICE